MGAWVTIGLFLFSATAHAQGFNCQKAATLAEKTICQNDELKLKDGAISLLYQNARSAHPADRRLVSSQRDWLKQRDACTAKAPDTAAVVSCLDEAYDDRQDYLLGMSERPISLF